MWACKCHASRLHAARSVVVSWHRASASARPKPLPKGPQSDVPLELAQPTMARTIPGKISSSDAASAAAMQPNPELADLYLKCQGALNRVNVRESGGVSIYFPRKQMLVDCTHCTIQDATEIAAQEKAERISSVEDFMWKEQHALSPAELTGAYLRLSKARLTALVVITAAGGYAMAPGTFDASAFLLSSLGTTFMSCSANAINQYFEVPYDAQMNRTKDRVLVRGTLTPLHAVTFAAVCGSVGFATLFFGVNTLTALLGLLNLALYTLAYTPMKRLSVANTWVGSLVGAIPPMMGWAACTGFLEIGAAWLAALLYSWQFPHFNALSWNLRADYSRAGYRMMSVTQPALCRRVALRHSVIITGLCLAAPAIGVTTWMFAVDSLPLNGYLVYLAWRFHQKGDSSTSRKLFRFSLIHIPALMVLMFIGKKRGEASASAATVSEASATNSPAAEAPAL